MPHDDAPAGTPLWYITFSDLMAILVGFFILLFGFSTMEANRFKLMAGSMREAFGQPRAPGSSGGGNAPSGLAPELGAPLGGGPGKAAVYEKAVAEIAALHLAGQVETSLDEKGVRVRVPDSLLFPPASASLQGDALPLLDRVALLAIRAGAVVAVEGHTDNQPVRSDVYPSNWELAGARAGAVVRYLAGRDMPAVRLEAHAFADSRPRGPNQTFEGRQKNRRVEILIRTER